jgi:predicted transcriptional regulator/transcriptional regulator with XRE-family HTH domain
MRRKLFAGDLIRRRRDELKLTQAAVAKRLKISASYLNQIESNQRPLTAVLLMEVSRVLRLNVVELSDDGPERLAAYLREMLADPIFGGASVGSRELRTLALSAPNFARAVLDLHAGYRRTEEKYRGLDEALQRGGPADSLGQQPFAYDEVRDFFHFIGNYVDLLDREAEAIAGGLWTREGVSYEGLADYIGSMLATRVILADSVEMSGLMSRYDASAGRLTLNRAQSAASRKFLLAGHIATRSQAGIIDAVVRDAGFRAEASNGIARLALANFFAGALLMPYGRFLAAARQTRYDVERLSEMFGASFEQICHRFSTLQRPGEEGVPFYFLRVDRAGNITKRHSATRLQFARYGGACPLWNIHEALEMPERFLVQVAEMPDGVRYLSVARSMVKPGGTFGAPQRHYAIGFGCEVTHASDVVYSDAVDLRASAQAARIGINCRICERAECHQRAVPPYGVSIAVDPDRRALLPYVLAGETQA